MKRRGSLPSRPKIIAKTALQMDCFGTINFAKITKPSLHKANSFACSLTNRDKPVAATLQRKCFGGIMLVIITKIITKENVPRNFLVIISARMVISLPWAHRTERNCKGSSEAVSVSSAQVTPHRSCHEIRRSTLLHTKSFQGNLQVQVQGAEHDSNHPCNPKLSTHVV